MRTLKTYFFAYSVAISTVRKCHIVEPNVFCTYPSFGMVRIMYRSVHIVKDFGHLFCVVLILNCRISVVFICFLPVNLKCNAICFVSVLKRRRTITPYIYIKYRRSTKHVFQSVCLKIHVMFSTFSTLDSKILNLSTLFNHNY